MLFEYKALKVGVPQKVPIFLLSQSASIVWFVCASIAFGSGIGMALIFPDPQARETVRQELTLDERVAYQYAIEGVYWRHRIWPRENPGPKPPLDAIVSQRQIEHKVEDYLRKSHSVADQRGLPITPKELQAEIDRMAQHSRRPDVLREIFYALGNDPFVIAECLGRPILAERLIVESKAEASTETIVELDSETNREAIADSLPSALNKNIARLEISAPPDCTDDTWTATSTVNGPAARMFHTAVWTGSEMIVWGGGLPESNTGGRYDPATDSWTATNTANAPDVRWLHTSVWTGSEMIVWGGGSDATNMLVNTGGRYNPSADSWTATGTATAPAGRDAHTAIWSGSEMIVWGGNGCGGNCNLNTGGRYDPATDRWTATNTTNAPVARVRPTAVWTGSEMIIWGGSDRMHYLNTGGKYDPRTDSWTPTSLVGDVPIGRYEHTAVWTGSEMIVWGGVDESLNLANTGGRYDPATDRWTATNTTNVPAARVRPTAVWTGSEMIVWGGAGEIADFNTGGRYNAGTDSWTPTTTANAPEARDSHTAVWTGSAMIVWGGSATSGLLLNTGGIYCEQSGPTVTPSPTPTPAATASATPNPISTPTPPATPSPAPTTSASPTATPIPGARAINLSTRLRVGTGNDVGIGGFIVSGTGPRHILLRGLGHSLGIPNALPDPMLCLQGSGIQTLCNNNWMDDPGQKALIEATGIPPTNNLDSAIVADLDPGPYTAILSGNGGVVGIGLVEIYDLSTNQDSRLANISTRGNVGIGNDIVIAGFILGGTRGEDTIIVRGLGPSLSGTGVSALTDPKLELRNSQGARIVFDDNWMDDPNQAAIIQGAGLAPSNNFESAIAATLMPGEYTALLSGVNNGTGVGLVEVYDNPAIGATPTPTPGPTPFIY